MVIISIHPFHDDLDGIFNRSKHVRRSMKKERPILFSTPMVQAILNGNKMQTRRVVKPQPPTDCNDEEPCIEFDYSNDNPRWYANWEMPLNPPKASESHTVYCPYGKPGDVLWVRETWFSTRFDCNELLECGVTSHIRYKADRNYNPRKDCVGRSWKPSIHMPKAAARIWLEITDVRVERLLDISEQDAISEGIDTETYKNAAAPRNFFDYTDPLGSPLSSAFMSFISLWDSINGEFAADENPWVWVVEFKRIEKPIQTN